jgi:lactate dehydrogenase-like 2-hydroxyacid dehydrogenase
MNLIMSVLSNTGRGVHCLRLQKMLNALRRNVLRRIYGPVFVDEQWRKKCNHEIGKLHKEAGLARNIKLKRL